METIQIRLPKELVRKAQTLVDNGIYSNKSEVVRDAVRRLVVTPNVEEINDNRKFIVLFTSDLHGNSEQYSKLFKRALSERADAVIIGGDIAPKNTERRTPEGQKKFLVREMFPIIKNFHKQNLLKVHECKIYIIMGNDDFKSNYWVLKKYEQKIGFRLIHNKCLKLHEDFKIAGYSYVPATPFKYKDWEKPDLYLVSEDQTRGKGKFVGNGVRSRGNKLMPYKLNLKDRSKSIELDLKRLMQQARTGKVILVSHAPPQNTNLDITHLNEHVGSAALRKVIEEKQPHVVLSGHIHETVEKSGTFKQRLGETTCIASGNDHRTGEVAVVEFNLYEPGKAKRLIM